MNHADRIRKNPLSKNLPERIRAHKDRKIIAAALEPALQDLRILPETLPKALPMPVQKAVRAWAQAEWEKEQDKKSGGHDAEILKCRKAWAEACEQHKDAISFADAHDSVIGLINLKRRNAAWEIMQSIIRGRSRDHWSLATLDSVPTEELDELRAVCGGNDTELYAKAEKALDRALSKLRRGMPNDGMDFNRMNSINMRIITGQMLGGRS